MLSWRPSWPCSRLPQPAVGALPMAVPELASFTTVAQKSSAADSARFSLELGIAIPGADKPLAVSAEGGFDTSAKRAQMTFDLSSFADLLKSFGTAFGGKVTGDLGSAGDWKLEAIRTATPRTSSSHSSPTSCLPARHGSRATRRRSPAPTPGSCSSSARSPAPTRATSSGCSRRSPARSPPSAATRSAASRRATTTRRSTRRSSRSSFRPPSARASAASTRPPGRPA